MGCDVSREKEPLDDVFDDVNIDAYINDPERAKKWESRLEYIDEPLCGGASCQVFKVKDKLANNKDPSILALKVMDGKYQGIRDMWINEVRILRILTKFAHQRNILEFVDAYCYMDKCYLLTRFYSGGDLFSAVETMDSQGYSERQAASMLRDMFRSLLVCHEQKVTHRDIKPENFVFEDNKRKSTLRLIDFGCSFKPTEIDIPAPLTLTKSSSNDKPITPPVNEPTTISDSTSPASKPRSASFFSVFPRGSTSQTTTSTQSRAILSEEEKNSLLDMQVPADRPHSLYYVAPEVLAPDVLLDARYRWARCEKCSELFYLKDLGKALRSGERAEERRGRTRPRTKSRADSTAMSPMMNHEDMNSPCISPLLSPDTMSPMSASLNGNSMQPLLSTFCLDGGSHIPDAHSRYRLKHKRSHTRQSQVFTFNNFDSLTLPGSNYDYDTTNTASRSLNNDGSLTTQDSNVAEVTLTNPISVPMSPLTIPTPLTTSQNAHNSTMLSSMPNTSSFNPVDPSNTCSFSPCMACGSMVCYERNVPFSSYCRVTEGLHMLLCHYDYHCKVNPRALQAVLNASMMQHTQQQQQQLHQQSHTQATNRAQTVPFPTVPPSINRASLTIEHFTEYNVQSIAYYSQQIQQQQQANGSNTELVLQSLPVSNAAALFSAYIRPIIDDNDSDVSSLASPSLDSRSRSSGSDKVDVHSLREGGWRVCEGCGVLHLSTEQHAHGPPSDEPSSKPNTPIKPKSLSRTSSTSSDVATSITGFQTCSQPVDALDKAFRSRGEFDPFALKISQPHCSAISAAKIKHQKAHGTQSFDDLSDDDDDESSPTQNNPASEKQDFFEITMSNLGTVDPHSLPQSSITAWTVPQSVYIPTPNKAKSPSRLCAISFLEPNFAMDPPASSLKHKPLPYCVSLDVGRVLTSRCWRSADVWAMGIVMYILLTGKTPFFHHDQTSLHALVSQCRWETPANISPQALHLLSTILVKDPTARPSAWQILHHPWLAPGSAPNAPLKHVALALMSLRKDAQAGHANLRRAIARRFLEMGWCDERYFANIDLVLSHIDHDGDQELSVDDIAAIMARLQGHTTTTKLDTLSLPNSNSSSTTRGSPLELSFVPSSTPSAPSSIDDRAAALEVCQGELPPTILPLHIAAAQDIMEQMQLTITGKLPVAELKVALAAATLGSSSSVLGPLEAIFDKLDLDHDGSLSANDLYQSCKQHLALPEAQDLVIVIGEYGKISKKDFFRAMIPSYKRATQFLLTLPRVPTNNDHSPILQAESPDIQYRNIPKMESFQDVEVDDIQLTSNIVSLNAMSRPSLNIDTNDVLSPEDIVLGDDLNDAVMTADEISIAITNNTDKHADLETMTNVSINESIIVLAEDGV